ncbi:MAG: peptidylprolyl isomerase [Bacteroidales bacterium]|nr:peptidylprolyl isomerase [Bacteroidales bacterium]
MNTRKLIIYLIVLLSSISSKAQNDDILLKVNDREVSADEFKWLYFKNNAGEQYSDIDEYLKLYIRLRLKVEAAEDAGIHLTSSFKNEFSAYRKQLAKNYLTDQEVKEELLERAYERYKTEINAYHILVRCPADAPAEDTLKAYNKAMNIRQRITLGEPFESVAKGASDDPTAIMNGGNLGFFTVFQTPLPFENAAYRMRVGELSIPVRTSSGYHIIKIQDKNPNPGRIKVAHIMKATPPGSTEAQRARAKLQIDSLYQILEEGADFSALARKHSDDNMSASNGGELPWFGSGEMIHEFSVAAFNLMRDNEYTKPVKTAYGWHIIKRLEKESLPSYEKAKKYLENRLSHSYLLEISKKSFAEKLKKEYNFNLNKNALNWFYEKADSAFRHGHQFKDIASLPGDILYSFASEECSMKDFAIYINQKGDHVPAWDSIIFINELLDQKVYSHLLEYEDSRLEEKYPGFRYLMNEFYDGILFFEMSDSLIWQRSVNDSTGLSSYYESRKDEFMEEAAAKARIFEIDSDAGRWKTRRLTRIIKRKHDRENFYTKIMDKAISGKDTLVNITEGTWDKGENKILDGIRWKEGIHETEHNNGIILVDILQIREERPMLLEDVKSTIIPDYQEYLEEQWVNKLMEKYDVSLNRAVLQKLKQESGK